MGLNLSYLVTVRVLSGVRVLNLSSFLFDRWKFESRIVKKCVKSFGFLRTQSKMGIPFKAPSSFLGPALLRNLMAILMKNIDKQKIFCKMHFVFQNFRVGGKLFVYFYHGKFRLVYWFYRGITAVIPRCSW